MQVLVGQITRKIKRVLQKAVVDHTVAERKTWTKFGQEKGNKPGPDRATTTVGENVSLKLSPGNKVRNPLSDLVLRMRMCNHSPLYVTKAAAKEESQEQTVKANLAKAGAGKVVCRLCKGDHFTAKCPYKESLSGLDGAGTSILLPVCSQSLRRRHSDTPPAGLDDTGTPAEPAAAAPAASTGGKYVPPSMRGGGRGPGESMSRPGGSRDDLPTLRVTNISEDTQENDLRELFGAFGRVARVYVGRDRETGAGKGFAFVSFEEKAVAQRAMEKMHGRGYDNLILNIQWSRTCSSVVLE